MIKTLSFAVVHFTIAFALGFAVTGSVLAGGALAIIEPTLNTIAFFFHEKAWQRLARPEPGAGLALAA